MAKKELLEKAQRAIADYIELSKFLFGDDAPMDVNEIPKDNKFYETARAISDDMELDWEKMSHEDSNRVMLNILAEYWANIPADQEEKPQLVITYKKVS